MAVTVQTEEVVVYKIHFNIKSRGFANHYGTKKKCVEKASEFVSN